MITVLDANKYSIAEDRMVFQDLWDYIMTFDSEDFGKMTLGRDTDFENETFRVKCYSWDDNDPDTSECDNKCLFWHKPSGYMLTWYKYPLRSPMTNMKISAEQFRAILEDCMNSHPSRINAKLRDLTYIKWWEPTTKNWDYVDKPKLKVKVKKRSTNKLTEDEIYDILRTCCLG